MKQFLYPAAAVLLFGQCTAPEPKTEEVHMNFDVQTNLLPYAISAEDSVYSAKVTLSSDMDTVVNFVVSLDYQGVLYRDSLPFTLVAGEKANGTIIFSECPVLAGEKPNITSTLKPIE